MKKLLITLSLLLTIAFASSGVAAQTDGVEAPDLEELAAGAYDVEGLQSVYDRSFSMDIEAIMASPDFDVESLDMSAMMNIISIQGITFDSEDNAKAYMDDMKSEMEAALEDEAAAEMLENVEITDIEDFDVEGLHIVTSMPDLEIEATMYVFIDGNHVFQIMSMNADAEVAQSSAEAVTQFVIDADVETEEVTFNEDGTSTGGVFDRMPTGDDEVVGELTDVMDMELHVAGE